VRNRKIAELNTYKEEDADKKMKDIQGLLKLMNNHAKLPKTSIDQKDGD